MISYYAIYFLVYCTTRYMSYFIRGLMKFVTTVHVASFNCQGTAYNMLEEFYVLF